MRAVRQFIEEEALKLIRRHQKYARLLSEEEERRFRRTAVRTTVSVLNPSHWACAPGFNPYYVRPRLDRIAYAVEAALRAHKYEPRPAVAYEVPKGDGTMRRVAVFQVADNAVSRLMFQSLNSKNAPIFGSRSYAYRTDVTVHDAIMHIASELRGRDRVFVAEYDFRKYFDTISHEHIFRIFREKMFFISQLEQEVLGRFLTAPTFDAATYSLARGTPRGSGIPQGTSVSLFLANAAALPLDRRLERLGVGFARYADDTVIWSTSYAEVCRAVEELGEAAREMGVEVNLLKSGGISVLTPEGAPAEMKQKSSITFLGHRIDSRKIGIKTARVAAIQEHVSYLAYANLLQPLIRNTFDPARIAPPIDRDYHVFALQLRRYLYGSVSEAQLRRHLAGETPLLRFYGLMSFYPTISDDEQLRMLDGWLLATVYRTLQKRRVLLGRQGTVALPNPHGLDKAALLSFVGRSTNGTKLDLRLPSFSRIAALVKTTAQVYGPAAISHPSTRYYD